MCGASAWATGVNPAGSGVASASGVWNSSQVIGSAPGSAVPEYGAHDPVSLACSEPPAVGVVSVRQSCPHTGQVFGSFAAEFPFGTVASHSWPCGQIWRVGIDGPRRL